DVAEHRFTEALAQCDMLHRPFALAGLGTLLLRVHRFEKAREQFAPAPDALGSASSGAETRLRLLDGPAEAVPRVGDGRAAAATSARVIELSEARYEADAMARIYRARAFSALGLLHWRAGARADAERAFIASLEVWPEPEKLRAGEAFVAWERLVALEEGRAAPCEGSPGDFCAIAWVRLGR